MAINLLTADQKPLATNILQGVSFTEEQMGGQDYDTGANGCAILPSAIGALEVTVIDQTTQGDHTVFVCEVTQAHRFQDSDPLTHKNTGWNYSG